MLESHWAQHWQGGGGVYLWQHICLPNRACQASLRGALDPRVSSAFGGVANRSARAIDLICTDVTLIDGARDADRVSSSHCGQACLNVATLTERDAALSGVL